MAEKKCIGFILIREYPKCTKKIGYFERFTTGEFLKYPDIWKPIYNHEDSYFTNVSLQELKGHYKTHFLTTDQFFELVVAWHNFNLNKEFHHLKT